MESRNPFRHILALVVTALPLVYLAFKWSNIPDTVALHFGPDGNPDRYGDKIHMLRWAVIGAAISLISYILVVNVHRLDKKRTKGVKSPLFDTIALAVVFFMSIISFATVINGIYPGSGVYAKVVMPSFGLLFIFLGNVFYNLKPNKFVGIRVPWTLKDNDNWKVTHRLGSKLFFVGGILITIVSLGYNVEIATLFLVGVVCIISVTTVLYSYLYHRKSQNEHV